VGSCTGAVAASAVDDEKARVSSNRVLMGASSSFSASLSPSLATASG